MQSTALSPQLLLNVLGSIVTEAVAFGLLDNGLAQTIIGLGGIVIPAVFSIAAALHLGAQAKAQAAVQSAQVHAAAVVRPPV